VRPALALGAPLALVAGCLTLGPRPQETRYYVLEAEASAREPTRPALPALAVGPVRLPAYLDRPEIVTRSGPVRLGVASADRWAAPLDDLFTSVLAEELRAAVPAREVFAQPWPAGPRPEWSVSVDVVRFDGEPDGTAVLEARWTVRRGDTLANEGVTIARERGGAPQIADTVAALSRTIGALARDIAEAVHESHGAAQLR
jgi:uncharacterized lipoprotein YmbA